jgi:hypothetical protein
MSAEMIAWGYQSSYDALQRNRFDLKLLCLKLLLIIDIFLVTNFQCLDDCIFRNQLAAFFDVRDKRVQALAQIITDDHPLQKIVC